MREWESTLEIFKLRAEEYKHATAHNLGFYDAGFYHGMNEGIRMCIKHLDEATQAYKLNEKSPDD